MSNEIENTNNETAAVEAAPVTEVKKKREVNSINPKYGIPVPLTLTCSKTGKVVMYTSPAYIKKQIEKAGSVEQLLAGYVCKEARAKPVKEKKPEAQAETEQTPSVE